MDGRKVTRVAGDPRRVGPYEVVGRLGEGGMGVVFLGRERRGGRPVAVKALRRELAGDAAFAARFRREVEAASRVSSPRVARVLGADPTGPSPWLATEYVEGRTLADAVAHGGPLAGERLAGFATGVAEALAAIHAAGVVHRDLKPGNVLLEEAADSSEPAPGAAEGPPGVKVIDFGIASAADATLTRSGLRFGTPSWMAPEQLRDQPAGPAADVFAWGALVAFAATGRHPFGGGPPEAVAFRILHDAPDLAGVPASLRPLVAAALSHDPAARPSAARLVADLAAALPPLSPVPTQVMAVPSVPTQVLPDPSPTAPRGRNRLARLLVALALLAGLVTVPQVVFAAVGGGSGDPVGQHASGKVCANDHASDDDEDAREETDDEAEEDDEEEPAAQTRESSESREAHQSHGSREARPDGSAGPPDRPAAPAPPVQPPSAPGPGPGAPVLGS